MVGGGGGLPGSGGGAAQPPPPGSSSPSLVRRRGSSANPTHPHQPAPFRHSIPSSPANPANYLAFRTTGILKHPPPPRPVARPATLFFTDAGYDGWSNWVLFRPVGIIGFWRGRLVCRIGQVGEVKGVVENLQDWAIGVAGRGGSGCELVANWLRAQLSGNYENLQRFGVGRGWWIFHDHEIFARRQHQVSSELAQIYNCARNYKVINHKQLAINYPNPNYQTDQINTCIIN